MVHITSVEFEGYKALARFSIRLAGMNILVGPNNCGKSTALGAFRVLALALRRARSKRAESLLGPEGLAPGWRVSDLVLPITIENIHTDYEEMDSLVEFRTSNGGLLTLYFPESGGCFFFANGPKGPIRSQTGFRDLPVNLQIVPVLGPLEHEEPLLTEETVRKNLATHRASRHFRNYWWLYPEGFNTFRDSLQRSWPGMDIQRPELQDDTLVMFCREDRIDRELYWAGFGFQVWCQMLTHLSRSNTATLLVVDEPEVYLHPDVQRQLLGILRELPSDVLLPLTRQRS